MPELTEAALRQKNASDANSEAAHEKQTVKGFHDERDRYKEFLVTGDCPPTPGKVDQQF